MIEILFQSVLYQSILLVQQQQLLRWLPLTCKKNEENIPVSLRQALLSFFSYH